MSVAATRKQFDDNDDRLQRGFWTEFRKPSNVEKATQLPMTPVAASGADGAVEVNANGKKVIFKMYKEEGRWKVGWMESFFPTGAPPAKK